MVGQQVMAAKEREAARAETVADEPLPASKVKMDVGAANGPPCRKCEKPMPCTSVWVHKDQKIRVSGMPFEVKVGARFELCVRCGSFFIAENVR